MNIGFVKPVPPETKDELASSKWLYKFKHDLWKEVVWIQLHLTGGKKGRIEQQLSDYIEISLSVS